MSGLIVPEVLQDEMLNEKGYVTLEYHGEDPDDFVALSVPSTWPMLTRPDDLALAFTRWVRAKERHRSLSQDTPEWFYNVERFG